MKRKISMLTVILLCVWGLTGCMGNEKLSDKFDEDAVKKSAKEVIELFNQGDYDTIVENWWSAQMKAMMPSEKIESDIAPIIDELGSFEAFDKEAVTGSTDKDTDQEFAVAIVKTKYENRNAQYTISFNTDMKVAGFYIK